MSDYLLKIGGSQKMIARWRCDNEEERNGYWKMQEEKRCRICGVAEGIEHVMIHMRIKIGVGAILDERRKGEVLKWMRDVKKQKKIHSSGIEVVGGCECS